MERVRSYLKKIADETWQLTNWVTHSSSVKRSDAGLALSATQNVIEAFVPMVLRVKVKAPERCGRCKSYRLAVDRRPEIGPVGAYVMRCEACGAEALRVDPPGDGGSFKSKRNTVIIEGRRRFSSGVSWTGVSWTDETSTKPVHETLRFQALWNPFRGRTEQSATDRASSCERFGVINSRRGRDLTDTH